MKAIDPDRDYKKDSYISCFNIIKEDLIIEIYLEDIKKVKAESVEIISAKTIYYITLILYLYIGVVEAV